MASKDLDAETLRVLLWLMLQRHGGKATFNRSDLAEIDTVGTILVSDDTDNIYITTVAAPHKHL